MRCVTLLTDFFCIKCQEKKTNKKISCCINNNQRGQIFFRDTEHIVMNYTELPTVISEIP